MSRAAVAVDVRHLWGIGFLGIRKSGWQMEGVWGTL